MLPSLSNQEILRYSRHLLIPEVGLDGQKKLKAAPVSVSPTTFTVFAPSRSRPGLTEKTADLNENPSQ